MIYLKLWALSYALVAVRAFQQKNVMGDYYWRALPTSYVFAGMDLMALYFGLDQFGEDPWPTVFAMGTGGWMGCWTSMFLHRKLNTYR